MVAQLKLRKSLMLLPRKSKNPTLVGLLEADQQLLKPREDPRSKETGPLLDLHLLVSKVVYAGS